MGHADDHIMLMARTPLHDRLNRRDEACPYEDLCRTSQVVICCMHGNNRPNNKYMRRLCACFILCTNLYHPLDMGIPMTAMFSPFSHTRFCSQTANGHVSVFTIFEVYNDPTCFFCHANLNKSSVFILYDLLL